MKKLKERWGITSNLQLVIIFLVFSITGSIALWVAKPLLNLADVNSETMNIWLYIPIRIGIIFPTYQVLVIIIGALFGQFEFFWNFEKKMLTRIGFKYFKKKR
tara:strand:+ start:2639 stop:2947 length:309 start_codon:yes stop_codon:yes gene_type:complete